MSTPVQAVGGVTPTTAISPAQPTPAPAQAPQSNDSPASTTVVVTRSASAPVYIYSVTDTATGRLLVAIPNAPAGESHGVLVDAKV